MKVLTYAVAVRHFLSSTDEKSWEKKPGRAFKAQSQTLKEYIQKGFAMLDDLRAREGCIEGEWIDELLARLAEVADKLQRLHFKSLGAILALQETIVRQWRDQPKTSAKPRPTATAKRPCLRSSARPFKRRLPG